MRCAPRPVLPRRNMETERERDATPRFPSPHLAFRAQCKPAHPAISRASRDAHSARVSALAEPPPQSSSAKRSSLRTGPSADRAETAWPARRRFFLFWGTRAVMVVDVIDAARSALCGGRRGGPSGRCGVVAAAGAAPGERGAHGPCMYHACWPGEGVAAAGSAPAMAMRAGGLINVARASSRPKSATAWEGTHIRHNRGGRREMLKSGGVIISVIYHDSKRSLATPAAPPEGRSTARGGRRVWQQGPLPETASRVVRGRGSSMQQPTPRHQPPPPSA
mmetsp:Transcript_44550/g.144789  ORF Transcript_44550/g.144789 Transcript_44550/m.144789 type:complete len:278 (-) Transcript_44550:2169-3002(-)